MEESLFTEALESKNMTDEKTTGRFGYEKELIKKQNQEAIGQNAAFGYETYETMKRESSREDFINSLYSNVEQSMADRLANREALNEIVTTRSAYDSEFEKVEKYSQVDVMQNLEELTYEKKNAEVCDERNSTKHSRRRKAKRDKALAKHKAAVMASSRAAFERFKTLGALGGIGDESMLNKRDKENIAVNIKEAIKTQNDLLKAIVDADEYDTNNNIKMRRVSKKRAIDMGDGTTEFFQKLSRIRTDIKCLPVKAMIANDYTYLGSYIPAEEQGRYELKANEYARTTVEGQEAVTKKIDMIANRIPDLVNALKPGAGEELKGLVENFKQSSDRNKKIKLVNTIMTSPLILSCIRRDMREDAVPTDFTGLADKIADDFKSISEV